MTADNIADRFPNPRKFRKRETWLKHRQSFIGASDAPILVGEGYGRSSPWHVWHSKMHGDMPSDADATNQHLMFGRLFERPIAEAYQLITGEQVQLPDSPFVTYQNPAHPELGCTPDAFCWHRDEWVPLQIKLVGHYNRDAWDHDGVPLMYRIQCQHEMIVLGAETLMLAAYTGAPPLQIRELQYDEEFASLLIDFERAWWRDHVVKNVPPEFAGTAAERKLLDHLYPVESGTVIDLPDAGPLLSQKDRVQRRISAYRTVQEKIDNTLRAMLEDASCGIVPMEDGSQRYVKWVTVNRKGYTVAESSSRRLSVTKSLPKEFRNVESNRTAADRITDRRESTADASSTTAAE